MNKLFNTDHAFVSPSTKALALFFFAVAVLSGFTFTSRSEAARFETGIAIVGTVDVKDAAITAKRVRAAGGSYLTTWVRWDTIAPLNKPVTWNPSDPLDPHYDWSSVDPWVTATVQAGLQPLFQVYGAPKWANRCKPPAHLTVESGAPCNANLDEMSDFFEAAAKRYSGNLPGLPRVRYWQVQNEPNLYLFFNPQLGPNGKHLSPDIYRATLKRMYATLKAVNRSNVVLAGGLAPNNPGEAVAPLDFARELLCLNSRNRPTRSPKCRGGVPMDIFDMHPYTSGGPTHRAVGKGNVQLGNLKQISAVVKAADRAGTIGGTNKGRTPLWVTELSWDSNAPDPGGVPMRIHTRWTAEAIYRVWQAGAKAFFWYSIRDRERGPGAWSDTDQSGLYFRAVSAENDRPKPSLRAFRFPFVSFADGRKGFRYWGRTPGGRSGKVSIRVRSTSGKWKRIGVAKANSSGIFRGYLRSRAGRRKQGSTQAVFGGSKSYPFSLKPVRDFTIRPFGDPVNG